MNALCKVEAQFIYLLYNRTRSTEHTHTKKNRPKNIKSNHKITIHIVKQLVSTQKSY